MTRYIKSVKFELLNPEILKKIAVTEITRDEAYDQDGYPIPGGVMDERLGVIDPGLRCKTCGLPSGRCPGHFGYIKLAKPVINVLFAEHIYKILQATCHKCFRIKIPEDKLAKFREIQRKLKNSNEKIAVLNRVVQIASKQEKCPHCGEPSVKIIFDKPYYYFIETQDGERIFLDPEQIDKWLSSIKDEDVPVLGLEEGSRPEWMIIKIFPVPPVVMRPSIVLETGGRAEDDLTHKLVDIIRTNNDLKDKIERGVPKAAIFSTWMGLQYNIATFINNKLSGVPVSKHRGTNVPIKGVIQRLSGKEGLFRKNLLGKRVNFTARTVISPDVFLKINEIGVPIDIAKKLTITVPVIKENLEDCKKLIDNYPNYPCALYVIDKSGMRFRVTEETKERLKEELKPGYQIERQLIDGDIVLFHRYPTLHRMNVLAHKIRVFNDRTFKMNVTNCVPFGADFDGDEMQIHVPQLLEAQVEVRELMDVKHHIISPRYGAPIIALNLDFTTGLYMLTDKKTKLTKKEACALLAEIDIYTLPEPDIEENGEKYWSGKLIFSQILPKDFNFEYIEKPDDPESEANVIIKDGKLIQGQITKKLIGSEKGLILSKLYHFYGPDVAQEFIEKCVRLSIKFLRMKGYSFSLFDLEFPENVKKEIKKIIKEGLNKVQEFLEKLEKGEIEVPLGVPKEDFKEVKIQEILMETKSKVSEIISKNINMDNNLLVIIRSGARGSLENIVQMSGMVGQVFLRAERIKRGYRNRVISHVKKGEDPMSSGFIIHCFFEGFTPIEMVPGCAAARDSLTDKTIKTQESGYTYRKLVFSLYDMRTDKDLKVVDDQGNVYQFLYGEDGLWPQYLEKGAIDIEYIIKKHLK